MQALELQDIGRVALVERPVPSIGPGDVLIRTAASTICTSDLVDVRENPFGGPIPRILGHEAAGIVVAVGAGVTNVSIGQLVASHPVISCGSCERCRRGLEHLCLEMQHLGVHQDGTFAEYFRTRANRVVAVPAAIDPCVAALLEPIAVCLHALHRGSVKSGDQVLIIGDGPFGILTARLAKRIGATVLMVGRHKFRIKHAAAALAVCEPDDPEPMRAIRRLAKREGVDVAILCAASKKAAELALQSLRARGRVVVFSAVTNQIELDLFSVHLRELELLGACNDEQCLEDVAELLADKELSLDELVTHRFPLERYEEALRLASKAKDAAIKVAFVMDQAV